MDMVAHVERFPIPGGHSAGSSLDVAPGGPAINVATGAARLGHPSILLGKIGADPLGDLLASALREESVTLPEGFVVSGSPTAVVLVLYDGNGRGEMRSFSFRQGSADGQLAEADMEPALLAGARALFLDGVLAFADALTAAGLRAAEIARSSGCRVFMDPNVRIPGNALPPDQAARMAALLAVSDEVLLNEREVFWISGMPPGGSGRPPVEAVIERLAGAYPLVACWTVKLGVEGCMVFAGGEVFSQPAFPTNVCDTSGAGDSFDAAWIAAFLEGRGRRDAARFASATASLTVAGKGAWRSLPRRSAVDAMLAERGM
ncbi:sugar kinase [Limnochorda pilosa]|uniref:Sugar kinase n=1 Tax=Limnochorda pilosa TaxID=1555112 RepID=A0A0K2SLB6_LIMPI|nr:sugar kinase [Limnochorda pilosa]